MYTYTSVVCKLSNNICSTCIDGYLIIIINIIDINKSPSGSPGPSH